MPTTPPVPVPFDDFFFRLAKELTNGVVVDLKTAITAGIVLGVTLFGARLLFLYFDFKIDTRIASASFKRASDYADKRGSYSAGTAGYDYYDALYRQDLSNAVSYSKKYKKKSLTVDPQKPAPFVFTDGSSPETPSFSAESDWESASLSGGGYVGFAVSEDEDADRSDWTLMQEADITGLEVDSASSFSSDRSDWTAMQEADITGLEVDSASSFSSDRSDWTAIQEADITGLEVDSASSFSSDRSDWTAFQDEEIGGLRLETPEDRMHHVLDNFSSFSDADVFSAIDGLDGNSSSLSDWTAVQESEITGLEMEPSSFSVSERTDWTAINDISFDDSRVRITSSANFSEDPGPADTDHPGWI